MPTAAERYRSRGPRARRPHIVGSAADNERPTLVAGGFVPVFRLYDDYSEGAHPEVLSAVVAGNHGQQPGYGTDEASRRAADRIRARFDVEGDVHFIPGGGTQANLLAMAAMLRPYEGVLAPSTGHIAVHETGAIEATGHKVLTVDTPDGLLTPELLDKGLSQHSDEHTVLPGAVFLTQASEQGTVYTLDALRELVPYAKSRGLQVYLDGARLSMALASPAAGMTPEDLGGLDLDGFVIGGTKVGGMFGEALVLTGEVPRRNFRYLLKQRGAMHAKSRFLGLQFERFFAGDDLWLRLGEQSNAQSARLAAGLRAAGAQLVRDPQINQVFAVLPDSVIGELSHEFGFYVWERFSPTESVVRLVTSWATPDDELDRFAETVRRTLSRASAA